ncbi:MAG: PVC-type heme-binding CxxCH protein [Planctomycetota bacterium]|nr:PVC-type heme-binding CxxCH protein [Planctomycetota bacterium]
MFRFLLPCLLFLACNFSAITISDAQNSRAKNPQARKSGGGTSVGQVETPRSLDDRLKISLFAAEPDVVTPTGIAINAQGRVFCIESHTHFRPKNYQGPPADRIRIYDDTDGDGRADRVKTFFEGSTATMNMAFAPDGSLYVATRARIFRLVDDNGDDKPDSNTVIVDLRTEGNYPHNGLSGLAFQDNQLYFGFGENLGVDYRLVGSDDTTLSGGGEGGNIYACNLDGSGLRRVATGFWNPFGLAFDKGGNLIAIDNDPDWRPPCRLLHIVEGGDYGYRFSHGRRGTHPFTAWFGELPGTLGLVSGTGEAPSGIVRCDPLSPDDTTSSVLSTSWGLHSIELFELQGDGATYRSVPQTLIKGGKDFRPVSLAWGPDGSIYVSDWCKRSYELHGYGRIWKIEIRAGETTATQSEVPTTYP